MDLRAVIQKELDERKWKRNDLAIQSGVSPSTLSRYLGESQEDLTVTQLIRIAEAFGKKAGDWLGRSEVDPRIEPFEEMLAELDGMPSDEKHEIATVLRDHVKLLKRWRRRSSNSESKKTKPGPRRPDGVGQYEMHARGK